MLIPLKIFHAISALSFVGIYTQAGSIQRTLLHDHRDAHLDEVDAMWTWGSAFPAELDLASSRCAKTSSDQHTATQFSSRDGLSTLEHMFGYVDGGDNPR